VATRIINGAALTEAGPRLPGHQLRARPSAAASNPDPALAPQAACGDSSCRSAWMLCPGQRRRRPPRSKYPP